MKETIAQRIIRERLENGQRYLGRTSGTYTFRKGSNLARKLEELGLTEADVDVRTAARAGRHANDGYRLLIFSLPQIKAPAGLSSADLAYWQGRANEISRVFCDGQPVQVVPSV